MVDAHSHPYESANLDQEIQDFRQNSGTHLLCAGADWKTSQKSVQLTQQYPEIYAAIGIHPEATQTIPDTQKFLDLVESKVIAIGECGLDYYPDTTSAQKDFQKKLLEFNLDLAKKTNLPLVVHCRNAFADLFANLNYPQVQMHCFTGGQAELDECLNRGWYISFGGILTFKSSQNLREVASRVPEDRLLVETDSPYLAPEPIRGTVNTSKNVKIVIEKLAQIRQKTYGEIEKITSENFFRLFNL